MCTSQIGGALQFYLTNIFQSIKKSLLAFQCGDNRWSCDNVMRLTKSGDNQRSCNNVMILTTTNMITDYSIIPALFCSAYNTKKKNSIKLWYTYLYGYKKYVWRQF
jgi:hypothetical protein